MCGVLDMAHYRVGDAQSVAYNSLHPAAASRTPHRAGSLHFEDALLLHVNLHARGGGAFRRGPIAEQHLGLDRIENTEVPQDLHAVSGGQHDVAQAAGL